MKQSSRGAASRIAFVGLMAAVVCVVTIFRIPFLNSQLHFANATCLLSGLLLGAVDGGFAAGFGSMFYDLFIGGYSFFESLVTFFNKGAMAFICAKIAYSGGRKVGDRSRVIWGSVVGALSYVGLYMLVSAFKDVFIKQLPVSALPVSLGMRLPASLLNAAFAFIVAPLFASALIPALKSAGLLEKITGEKQ